MSQCAALGCGKSAQSVSREEDVAQVIQKLNDSKQDVTSVGSCRNGVLRLAIDAFFDYGPDRTAI
jgi:hypothetical protein